MPSEKKVPTYDFVEDTSRAEQIKETISKVPDLTGEEMADFTVKMNHAIVLGEHKPTSVEAASLKLLSSKFIPDAPKQINLNASVRTETVILKYLETNDLKRAKIMDKAAEFREVEEAVTVAMPEFADSLRTEESGN